MINIASNIQNYRKQYNMTQDELAHYLNLTKATISKWENQLSYPDIKYLPLLANLFEVTIDVLVGHSPYLSREKITALHTYLVQKSNVNTFAEVIDEIEELYKTYTNDAATVLMLSKVLINNSFLLIERKDELIDQTLNYLNRLIEKSNEPYIVQEAIFLKSSCMFMSGHYEEVVEELKLRPFKLGEELLLANSYMMLGKQQKATEVIQAEMYQQVILMINHLNMMIRYRLSNDIEEVIKRAETIVDCFKLNTLHPNTALNFHLLAATYYVEINADKAILHLKAYLQCCKEFIENYYLHGDSFFNAIDSWLADSSTGIIAPVDKENIKTLFIDVINQMSEFDVLRERQDFKNICYSLSHLK